MLLEKISKPKRLKPSLTRSKYRYLIKQIKDEFGECIKETLMSNTQNEIQQYLKEYGYHIQILSIGSSIHSNGSWTDKYEVNVHISSYKKKQVQDILQMIYMCFKNNLQGVDAGDIWKNLSIGENYNYSFRVLIQEGV